jgi:hypothetical protein
MARQACINIQRCPSIRQAVHHDARLSLADHRPSYLLPDRYHLGNFEVPGSLSLNECLAIEAHKHSIASQKAKRTQGYSPIDEGVIILAGLPAPPAQEALARYKADQQARLAEWRTRFEQMTGQRILRIDIHLDEGYLDAVGVPHYNGHAHVLIDRTDERGRVIRFTRKDDVEYRTLGELNSELQSMTAEVLRMERGERGSRRRRLSHHQYREAMQQANRGQVQVVAQLTVERDRARDAERDARAAERVAKAEAKELYDQLRDLMVASGVAKAKDYSAVKQIKADIGKLTEAIKLWREKTGEPAARPIARSPETEPGDSHGSEQRPRKRHDVAPLHPFLVGAVALTGRTPAGREYTVRAMQKRLLDSNGEGLDVPLSRVIQGSVDDRAPRGDPRLRRGAAGRVAERSASTPREDQRETHAIYMELYYSMKSVGRIAGQVPAAEGLRAKAPAYPEAKRRSEAGDREWLIAQLAEWQKRLRQAEALEAAAAGELRDRVRDAEAAAEGEKQGREADRSVRRGRRTYRPGFGGQGLGGGDKFAFVELEREWDQHARCTAYKRGREVWFVTTRSRVEVINQTDQSLVVALKVAAKKFGDRIEITGPQEFRQRAARLATRLGIEVADPDLQHIVQAEKGVLARDSVRVHRGPEIERQAGAEPDDDEPEPPRDQSR